MGVRVAGSEVQGGLVMRVGCECKDRVLQGSSPVQVSSVLASSPQSSREVTSAEQSLAKVVGDKEVARATARANFILVLVLLIASGTLPQGSSILSCAR